MKVFSPIDEGIAILRTAGVYTQVPLFTYDGRVFAKCGGGFIALYKHKTGELGATSKPVTGWLEVSLENIEYDKVGRMILADAGE